MGTKQVWQVLQPSIGMVLYCQKDKLVDPMFQQVFVDNMRSFGCANRASL